MSEWTEWVKRFRESKKCIFPEQEYEHKVACREPATTTSKDGYPSCEHHRNFKMKKEWSGCIKGA